MFLDEKPYPVELEAVMYALGKGMLEHPEAKRVLNPTFDEAEWNKTYAYDRLQVITVKYNVKDINQWLSLITCFYRYINDGSKVDFNTYCLTGAILQAGENDSKELPIIAPMHNDENGKLSQVISRIDKLVDLDKLQYHEKPFLIYIDGDFDKYPTPYQYKRDNENKLFRKNKGPESNERIINVLTYLHAYIVALHCGRKPHMDSQMEATMKAFGFTL